MSTTNPSASRRWLGPFLLGLALAGGLVTATFVFTRTLMKSKLVEQSIDVKGYAEKKITADRASWSGSFGVSAPVLTDAYQKLQDDTNKVLLQLDKLGIKRDAVELAPVRITAMHKKDDKGNDTNQIEGFWLVQWFDVRSDDVHLIERVAKGASTLIQSGVQLESQHPCYLYTKLNDLKSDLLAEATRNAHQRAEQLASNSGSAVGPLRYAKQGVFQITPVDSTNVSDSGDYDTSSLDKVVKAVVTVQFAIR